MIWDLKFFPFLGHIFSLVLLIIHQKYLWFFLRFIYNKYDAYYTINPLSTIKKVKKNETFRNWIENAMKKNEYNRLRPSSWSVTPVLQTNYYIWHAWFWTARRSRYAHSDLWRLGWLTLQSPQSVETWRYSQNCNKMLGTIWVDTSGLVLDELAKHGIKVRTGFLVVLTTFAMK